MCHFINASNVTTKRSVIDPVYKVREKESFILELICTASCAQQHKINYALKKANIIKAGATKLEKLYLMLLAWDTGK